jgi:hypothetical protein
MMASCLEIVDEWHTALNSGDADRLAALVDDDVEVGGPRGTAKGAQVVLEWFGRANVRFKPLRSFSHDNTVVVEQNGEWLSDDRQQIASAQVVSTVFVLTNGLISRIIRYDDLDSALEAAGMDNSHEDQ